MIRQDTVSKKEKFLHPSYFFTHGETLTEKLSPTTKNLWRFNTHNYPTRKTMTLKEVSYFYGVKRISKWGTSCDRKKV